MYRSAFLTLAVVLFSAQAMHSQLNKRLSTGGDSRIKDVLELNDERLLAIGQHFTYTDSVTVPNMLLIMSADGTVQDTLYVGQDGPNKKNKNAPMLDRRLKCAVQFPTGEIYLIGSQRWSYPAKSALWLVRINEKLEILGDYVFENLPAANMYYMQAKIIDTHLYVVYQSSEEYDLNRYPAYRSDVRVAQFDSNLTLSNQWKHFAKVEKNAYESIELTTAYFGEQALYFGTTCTWADSLELSYERKDDPLGSKIFEVTYDKNSFALRYHHPPGSQIRTIAANGSSLYFTDQKHFKDAQNKFTFTSSLWLLNTQSETTKLCELEPKIACRKLHFSNDSLWLAADGRCIKGNFRSLRIFDNQGKLLKRDDSFCDYNKEHVGLLPLRSGGLLEYFIDNGWYVKQHN